LEEGIILTARELLVLAILVALFVWIGLQLMRTPRR
jgi:hypothetical protein